jgi:hypothetical protein
MDWLALRTAIPLKAVSRAMSSTWAFLHLSVQGGAVTRALGAIGRLEGELTNALEDIGGLA